MKRIVFTIFLSLVIVFFLASIASAQSLGNEKQIEKKLIKMGYTKQQIYLLSDAVKAELAKQKDLGAKLVSFKHAEMKESNIPPGEVGIQGEIPSNELSLNLSILDYGVDSNDWNKRKIYSDFEWLNEPYWKLTDKIGVAWADGWNIVEDSDALVYQYYGEQTNDLETEYYYDGEYTAEAGVNFENLDLKELMPNGNEHTKDHSGWAKIEIGKYVNQTEEDDTERTDVLTKYYHKNTSIGASGAISITGGPSITITHEDNYDFAQDLTYFDWPK
ncbi:MAG: hypothetical protein K9L17_07220 [Clostridiales bacterium]|nr:hypothetical protein [Clostridiales bacterium]MCF8022462.1 hypothetical protein [Clostridiales bacterium]